MNPLGQKLKGRLEREHIVLGFGNIKNDTNSLQDKLRILYNTDRFRFYIFIRENMPIEYTGIVRSLYVHQGGCFILLDPTPTVIDKPGHYIYLLLTHPNYASIYALLMASAANRIAINLRVNQHVVNDYPPVEYAQLNFG